MNERFEEINKLANLSREEIGEHEEAVKMNFIVPFLQILGHERPNFESARSDILLKRGLPNNCAVLIECKRYDKPLAECVEQLKGYWDNQRSLLAILINGEEIRIYSPFWRGRNFENTFIYSFRRENLSKQYVIEPLFNILSRNALIDKTANYHIDQREKEIDIIRGKQENIIEGLKNHERMLENDLNSINVKIAGIRFEIEQKSKEMWDSLGLPQTNIQSSSPPMHSVEIDDHQNTENDELDIIKKSILKCLIEKGGMCPSKIVIQEVYGKIRENLPSYWKVKDSTGPRWKHAIHSLATQWRKKGILKNVRNSGRGLWALTERGRTYAENVVR